MKNEYISLNLQWASLNEIKVILSYFTILRKLRNKTKYKKKIHITKSMVDEQQHMKEISEKITREREIRKYW